MRIKTVAAPAAAAAAGLLLYVAFSDTRPHCVAPEPRVEYFPITAKPIFGGKKFNHPVQLIDEPGEQGSWLVVLHGGIIERVRDSGATVSRVLDITKRVDRGKQWGLQQVALHPRFPEDARLFAAYTAEGHVSRVSVFRSSDGGQSFDPQSEAVLLSEAQRGPWHPIGGLAFGVDGFLYVGWGIGGLDESNPKMLRGKMLRVDVDSPSDGRRYSIPRDNPFQNGDVIPEAYAVGLRNPWRFTFDRATGDLWLGDVGELAYEEIDRIQAGADYGWPAWEGTACRLAGRCNAGAIPPVHAHATSDVCAVIGGYVYHGARFPELRGQYVYGDACSGTIYALDPRQEHPAPRIVARTGLRIASFAEDRDGELYLVGSSDVEEDGDYFGLHELAANTQPAAPPPAHTPRLLSATGCLADSGFATPARGLLSYSLAMPAWHEGAEVVRFVTDASLWPRTGVENALSPKPGAILIKTFALEHRPVETQMLARRASGTWDAYDYRWNAEGTDAELIDHAMTVELGGGPQWSFPGPDQCFRCHDTRAGLLLGFSVSQLNHDDQIQRLEDLGFLEWTWRDQELPRTPRLDDRTVGVAERARAYLDTNCAHCHQPGAAGSATAMDLRSATPFGLTGLCSATPRVEMPGHEDALVIAPGRPERSLISIRMHASDAQAMPPGRRTVDTVGTAVVDEWIRALRGCPQ